MYVLHTYTGCTIYVHFLKLCLWISYQYPHQLLYGKQHHTVLYIATVPISLLNTDIHQCALCQVPYLHRHYSKNLISPNTQ